MIVFTYIYTILSMYLFSLHTRKGQCQWCEAHGLYTLAPKGTGRMPPRHLEMICHDWCQLFFWEEEQLRATISKNKHIIWHHRKRCSIRSSFSKRTCSTFIYITSQEGLEDDGAFWGSDALGSLKILWSVWLGELCRHFHPVVMTCRNAGVMRP